MTFGSEKLHFVQKVIKNNNGDIVGYSLDNGEIIMQEEAISMAAQGTITGLSMVSDNSDKVYTKSDLNNTRGL